MASVDRLAWRTSSRSGNGENCVEVAPSSDGAIIRHSKHPAAGTISFSRSSWAVFLHDALEGGSTSANGVAAIIPAGANTWVRSLSTDVELCFDEGEWTAFLGGASDGEFAFPEELVNAL
jgi:Domain of unknown function (DUF397)